MRPNKHPFSDTFLLYLGDALRARRISMFMSQEKLGELSSLHRSYITEVERGLRNISMITLRKIAKALQTRASTPIGAAEDSMDNEQRDNEKK